VVGGFPLADGGFMFADVVEREHLFDVHVGRRPEQ
jgi:hypothetical protein